MSTTEPTPKWDWSKPSTFKSEWTSSFLIGPDGTVIKEKNPMEIENERLKKRVAELEQVIAVLEVKITILEEKADRIENEIKSTR